MKLGLDILVKIIKNKCWIDFTLNAHRGCLGVALWNKFRTLLEMNNMSPVEYEENVMLDIIGLLARYI